MILLLLPSKGWDYRHVPSCPGLCGNGEQSPGSILSKHSTNWVPVQPPQLHLDSILHSGHYLNSVSEKNLSTSKTCPYKSIIKNIKKKLPFIFAVDGGYHRNWQRKRREHVTMDCSAQTGGALSQALLPQFREHRRRMARLWEPGLGKNAVERCPLNTTAVVLMDSCSGGCLQKTCPRPGQRTRQLRRQRPHEGHL